MDIARWTECCPLLVAVLVTKHPGKTAQFMGYLRNIVRASQNFEGAAWASYDAAFSCHAENCKSLDWAIINPTIYNEAFTGRARLLPRYWYCLQHQLVATHKNHSEKKGKGPEAWHFNYFIPVICVPSVSMIS